MIARMKDVKQRVIILLLMFSLFRCGYAQEMNRADCTAEPAVLYFRFDKALVDSGYLDNRHTLLRLEALFSDSALAARIDTITIVSHASPEGSQQYNFRLAHRRAVAVKGYLLWKYPYLDQKRIFIRPQGEDRSGLRELVEADTSVPDRAEVLRILNAESGKRRWDHALSALNGGNAYRYIMRHLLPRLRNAAVCTVTVREVRHPEVLMADEQAVWRMPTDNSAAQQYFESPHTQDSSVSASLRSAKPLFALKTNLLFDAALMPNIELEVPIGKRWSVNGEYTFPWWLFDGDKYSLQILMGGLEGRYWLGRRSKRQIRDVLTGHFLGLYAGGGKYDLQWQENGYQGEFFIAAGISYGYAHKIACNLRLEYNIGIGMLRTNYRHYHARDNYQTLLWQENGKYTWFGPTKAKISLVWLLNRKTKVQKGGAR